MDEEVITFGDIEIEKRNFLCYRSPIFLENINTDIILVSHKIYSSEANNKYFIGYLYDDYGIQPLNIILPKMSTYIKDGKTKAIYF